LEDGDLQAALAALNDPQCPFEYTFLNGDMMFQILFEQLDKTVYDKHAKFHQLKGRTKEQNPTLNREERRALLKKNIEEFDRDRFKNKIRNYYLMKDQK
jgi:hypothetical protein